MPKKKSKKPPFRKRYPHIYYLSVGVGLVMFWRGTWGFLDHYVFPGEHYASYIICGLAGLVILYLNDFSLEELRG